MKILRADKFQAKKRSKKEGLNSATPETKEEYTRIDEELEDQPADGYAEQNFSPDPEPRTKDESQARAGAEPDGLSDKLSKAYVSRLQNQDLNPESQSNGKLTSKGEAQPKSANKPADPSGQAPGGYPQRESKDLPDQNLQAFFEQLPADYLDSEHRSSEEPPLKNMNLPDNTLEPGLEGNNEQLSKDRQQAELLSVHIHNKDAERTQKSSRIGLMPIKASASGETMRPVDLRAVSKFDDRHEKKPRRKKKGSGGSGGDITGPPSFSLRDIFHVIFKRKVQILLFFVAVFVTVAIGTFLATPVYNASAQILIKLGREDVFVPTSGDARPFITSGREERINSEIEILKSRALAEKAVKEIGPTVLYEKLKDDKSSLFDRLFPSPATKLSGDEKVASEFESAATIFLDSLAIEAISKSNVVRLNFKHTNPQTAALVANKLAEMYLDHRLAVHKTTKNVKFFKDQSELLKSKMTQFEEALKALKEKHNITDLGEERAIFLRQIADLRAELNKTLSQRAETERRISQLRRQLSSTPSRISQGEEFDRNEVLIGNLEARLVELELKEKELLTKYTDGSRLIESVKEEIRIVSEKLAEQEKKSYTRKRSGANPTYQKLQETLFQNEAELNAIMAKAEAQQSQLINYQNQMDKLNQIEDELNQLKQQVNVNRENYLLYLSKFEESRISDAMDSEKIASVSLIQPARAPKEPVSPKKGLNMVLAVLLGAIGGLGLAFFMEHIDDKIEKVDDVEKGLKLPVLASIPIFEKKVVGA